ncbi:MAG: carboxypeptidase regulatory-like domain-containing protein [Vicinamibacterales bacterium]
MRGIVTVSFAAVAVLALVARPAGQTPVVARPGGTTAGSSGQSAASGTGAITGVVTDATTGQPVPGAVVYLLSTSRRDGLPMPRMVADPRGRFVFRDLPAADDYQVGASHFGYERGAYGRTEPGGPAGQVALADGQWVRDVSIRLWKLGVISGRVVDERNEPVVGVAVRVFATRSIAGRPYLVGGSVDSTDDRGVYRIANLQPGRYQVALLSVQSTILASTPEGAPLRPIGGLASGGYSGNARLGGAVGDASVNLDDRHRLAITNFGTPPPPGDGTPRAYPAQFYPGVRTHEAAETLVVELGTDRTGVDFQMRPVPAARVSGRVEGGSGEVANIMLRLMPEGLERLDFGVEAATTLVEPDGSFTFLNVPAGAYTLVMQPAIMAFSFGPGSIRLPEPAGLVTSGISVGSLRAAPDVGYLRSTVEHGGDVWARQPVSVGSSDVTGLVVRLQPTVKVSGRIAFDGDTARPTERDAFRLAIEPADGDPALGTSSAFIRNGETTFTIEGVLPGRYALNRQLGRWYIMSAVWNGRDITASGLDTSTGGDVTDVVITVTDKAIELGGVARDRQGQPAAASAVIAFPVDRARWTSYGWSPNDFRTATAGATGSFRLPYLVAGEYYVVAVDAAQADAWTDPRFLEAAVPHATRVTLDWGDHKTQDVVLAEVVVR